MRTIKFWDSEEELSKKLKELWWNPKWLSLHDLQWEVYSKMATIRGDYYKNKQDKLWPDPEPIRDMLHLMRWFPYL
jgi:hypothetical protein